MSLEKYKEKLQKMKVASAFGMPHEAATALIDAHLKAIKGLEFYANGYCDHERDREDILSGESKPQWKLPMTYGHYARQILSQITESK